MKQNFLSAKMVLVYMVFIICAAHCCACWMKPIPASREHRHCSFNQIIYDSFYLNNKRYFILNCSSCGRKDTFPPVSIKKVQPPSRLFPNMGYIRLDSGVNDFGMTREAVIDSMAKKGWNMKDLIFQ